MKILKYILATILVVVLGIQFVPVDRSNPPVVSDLNAPLKVKEVLKRSCYDCHSNETTWPWYSYVAPVSWLVAYDVKEGRDELNFSEWNRYSKDSDVKEEIFEEIAEGEMPLNIYLITHPGASVSAPELATIKEWARVRSGERTEDHDDD